MPLVVFHTQRVRDALKAPARLGVDLLFLGFVGGVIGLLLLFGEQVSSKYHDKIEISLSFWALPKYTVLSLSRGFAAYFLSLVFTLIYGTVAAHNRRAERIMVPALDVLQSIPVLSFLPGLVLAMISIFPTREIGLEIACVIMIFTAQAWNMTFSFYGSLRNIPKPLLEVAQVHYLSRWRVFKLLEVPASMIGLVWNSMMSMAGGWFFLTVNEAFTLGDRDFRLPGIGSYMQEAINRDDRSAMVAAVIAMIIMIVMVDQCFWRPIVVWSERFKFEETADTDKAQSWVLNLLQHSRLWRWVGKKLKKRHQADQGSSSNGPTAPPPPSRAVPTNRFAIAPKPGKGTAAKIGGWAFVLLLIVGSAWGAWNIIRLLIALPLHDSPTQSDWVHVLLALVASFLRTTTAVVLGAVWALPAGILIGLSPRWSQRLQPIIQVAASFPAPMLFPLVTVLLVMMHVPFTAGCITLMLLGTQWYILFNVIAGAMAIPGELKEVGRVYGTPWWEKWTRIYIPGVFPYLVTGLITAAGGAWNATIVSEFVQVKDQTYIAFGLGSIISQASTQTNYPLLAAGTVTMAVSVVVLNRLIWKRLYRLAENRYSLNV